LGCLLRKQRFRGVLTVISTAPIRPNAQAPVVLVSDFSIAE
jgi:hypothetical protein